MAHPSIMKARKAVTLAWFAVSLTLLLMAGNVLLALLSRSAFVPGDPVYSWESRVILPLGALSALIVGGLIAARQPDNPYGWIWLFFAFNFGGLLPFSQSYVIYSVSATPGSLPLEGLAVLLASWSWIVGIAMLPWILLLFPTGRLPSRRWRAVGWAIIAATLIAVATIWAAPGESGVVPAENPLGIEGAAGEVLQVIAFISVLIVLIGIIPGVFSLVIRYRQASGVERQQLKWFAYGAVVFAAYFISDFVYELPGVWESVKEAVFFAVLPVTIGMAILRYRLFDIDVIIRRTLVYAVLTVALGLVYFGSVVLIQALLRPITGQESELAIVGSTLAIAALFNPLRRRVQDAIDRRFYRRKYDAAQTLATFAQTARDEVELDVLRTELLHVVETTLQPTHISLWLKPTNEIKKIDIQTS